MSRKSGLGFQGWERQNLVNILNLNGKTRQDQKSRPQTSKLNPKFKTQKLKLPILAKKKKKRNKNAVFEVQRWYYLANHSTERSCNMVFTLYSIVLKNKTKHDIIQWFRYHGNTMVFLALYLWVTAVTTSQSHTDSLLQCVIPNFTLII